MRRALLAVNAATSRGVSGTAFVVLAWLRTPWMFAFVGGALLNALLGKMLKYSLNVSRPAGAALATPGMPSSHATSLFYFATALSLAAAGAPGRLLPLPWLAVPVLTFCYSVSVAYARIFLTKVHTIPQVAVGAALGSTFAVLWTSHVLSSCSADEILSHRNAFCGLQLNKLSDTASDL